MNWEAFLNDVRPESSGWKVIDNEDGTSRVEGWDAKRFGPFPDTTEQQAWAARQLTQRQSRSTRRAALAALRDGTGDLTARQLTAILRVLAREVLGED